MVVAVVVVIVVVGCYFFLFCLLIRACFADVAADIIGAAAVAPVAPIAVAVVVAVAVCADSLALLYVSVDAAVALVTANRKNYFWARPVVTEQLTHVL